MRLCREDSISEAGYGLRSAKQYADFVTTALHCERACDVLNDRVGSTNGRFFKPIRARLHALHWIDSRD